MQLTHGIIKDMQSRTIVGNCRSEKIFGVDVHRDSDSTALNCYIRGSNYEIQNRLPIVAIVQRGSDDQG